ncbi:hypothetical protein KF840_03000 [bacterium]|nr:hypothetical protein [bacterium]
MAKPGTDQRQAVGERLLTDWGVAADADVAALTAHAGRAADADVAIAHRLGGIASQASARQLQQMRAAATDKGLRKEIKRALYRLEQRGVAIADGPAAAPVATPPSAPPLEGYVSSVDGRGDQLVWLIRPQPGGVLHLFAVINDVEGLREVALHSASRKALKTLRGELEQRHDVRLAAVDWRHADALVRRAFEAARASGGRMEGDYPALRAQLWREAPTEASPLPPPAADAAALARSADMLGEPELRTWFRPAEELAPFLEEFSSVQDSPLVLNELQQRERFDDILARAVDHTFGGAQSERWGRRLAEMARYFAATRRPDRAAEAGAVAAALAAGAPPRDIPFCDQLVRASFAYFAQLAARQEAERAKGSLIVTPGQAARQREPR